MLSFATGFVLAALLAVMRANHVNNRNIKILKSIHRGYAIPDENGNIGWVRK